MTMTNKQKLLLAFSKELPVRAHVKLYDGRNRVRLGFVTSIKNDHVIIYDVHKGYRTTPLPFVKNVRILPKPT